MYNSPTPVWVFWGAAGEESEAHVGDVGQSSWGIAGEHLGTKRQGQYKHEFGEVQPVEILVFLSRRTKWC